jgi:iron complex transport system ATP-binding protein
LVFLEISGISFRYKSVEVLENISFSIGEGEFVGILGPNGSGKTTLLKTISGLLKPYTGVVLLNGADIHRMASRDIARQMAVVPQDSVVAFDFTALDIVLMGRNPHLSKFQLENPRDLSIAKKALELTGVWHLADRPIAEVSGGERQRIVIARALAQEPRILLLDEPTLHLDIDSQIDVMDLLKNLCKKDRLIVMAVLHDFNLAARYCDKIILLHEKKIVSLGRAEEVLNKENMANVFGVEAIVKRHPMTDTLYVIPLSSSPMKGKTDGKFKVHVICGGGTGASLMARLVKRGWDVTAGVLNVLDTDHEAARMLDIQIASEAPFSPISKETYEENGKLIQLADVVIVTDFPVGYGNLKNLEAATLALEKGIPTLVINSVPIRERDFTNGEAEKYFQKLVNSGAIIVETPDEVLRIIEGVVSQRLPVNNSSKRLCRFRAETNSKTMTQTDS